MSLKHIDVELEMNGNAIRSQVLWNAGKTSKTHHHPATRTLNVRVVEFIAKPQKVQYLEDCVRGEIMEFLNQQNGFSGAMILNSHQERRLILVVSFWATQRMAAENSWESSRIVRQTVGSLIDVCSRVHTYEAELANSIEFRQENDNSQLEWPEVSE